MQRGRRERFRCRREPSIDSAHTREQQSVCSRVVFATASCAAWRAKLSAGRSAPRADAAAWAVIDALPAHPVINAPVAAAVTGRSKPQIYEALERLVTAGVLAPLSPSRRNRAWEAVGLLDLLQRLEGGRLRP